VIRKPKFKSHLRVEVVPPDLTFFLSESGYEVLQGRILFLIAPLINGHNTASQIVKQANELTEFDVECGLLLLESEGYLADSNDRLSPGLAAFRDSLEINPKAFAIGLKLKRVCVRSLGKISTEPLVSILQNLGVQVAEKGNFTVVLTDNYLRDELKDLNRQAIRNGKPWMIIKPTGSIIWFGPIFEPRSSACWQCLAKRLKQNRRAESYIEANRERKQPLSLESAPEILPMNNAALNLGATEALKYLTEGTNHRNSTALSTLDLRDMKLEKHAVMRLEDCDECAESRSAKKDPPQIILKSVKKIFTHDGGHRSCSADTTFQKYKHLISPLTGIVDQVKFYHSDPNNLVHTSSAGHLFLSEVPRQDVLRRGLVQKSAGKGMTPQQAKTSALCEALEHYSGVFRGNEFRIEASYRELGDRAIHPNDCMHFSEKQYAHREEWNRRHIGRNWIPMKFDEHRIIEWTPVWSLTSKKKKYIPTAYCYYGYPMQDDHNFCRADSNGDAAGNTIEEAILHGFMEVVERDCVALWWYNRLRKPGVNLDSFHFPYFKALQEYYRTDGRDIWVLDITSDFGIATFAALSTVKQNRKREFLMGLGTHFDPQVALSRALTEMNQFLPVAVSGKSTRVLKPKAIDLGYVRPDPNVPPRKFEDYSNDASNDFLDDVKRCIQLAKSCGLEIFVLNRTRSDVGLPVVKVIVPGLQHFWARFGNPRLYDLPIKLGWLKRPLREEHLNPDPFWI
jgi:oxazoline/thiazoline synthase